jgi:anti-sigma factor RsiW
MTTCKTIQPRLTAYLDGDLTDERGSVVRGHLRECAACRQIASDEAALRDGLRALAPVDPPSSLWAGVQARLAAEEVADARKPRWRHALARWVPTLPRFAAGLAVAATAVLVLAWRARSVEEPVASADAESRDPIALVRPEAQHDSQPEPQQLSGLPAGDVTADLLAESAQTTASYDAVVEELMKLASEARSGWDDQRIAAYDARVAELRASIAAAAQGRPQQRAQRALIRYLQGAVVRDDMLLASGGHP